MSHETGHDDAASLSDLFSLIGGQDTHVYSARFTALNNSGVDANALVVQNDDSVSVLIRASGMEPGSPHAQHIHGPSGGSSAEPTLAQDADHDGFVELNEGLIKYGQVILNLSTNPDVATDTPIGSSTAAHEHGSLTFPTTDADGNLYYAETFHFHPSDPVSASLLDELQPLDHREIVLHGMTLQEGQGETNSASLPPNEADGTAGYKAVLPVAVGELREITTADGFDHATHDLLCDDATGVCLSAQEFFHLANAQNADPFV
jgi:hypothetical protein